MKIEPAFDVPYLKRVELLPFADTLKKEKDYDLVKDYLTPYFQDAYRPIVKGDVFECYSMEFKVMAVEPGTFGIVEPNTKIICEGDPLTRTDD